MSFQAQNPEKLAQAGGTGYDNKGAGKADYLHFASIKTNCCINNVIKLNVIIYK